MIGKKTSGWVSEYIDQFFEKMIPDKFEKSPKGLKRFFEEDSISKKKYTEEFQRNFSELFDLFMRMYDIIG